MIYENMVPGTFLSRPNRFIAQVTIHGKEETVHVKNTGRCKELLVPGAKIYLQDCESPQRKTRYDLIAVEKGKLLVNMDAQAPNKVFREWAETGAFEKNLQLLKSEKTYGKSRFDFYWETQGERGFVEVKGVTLEENAHAKFPDAPTERGVKHIHELISAKKQGFQAAICFIVQMEGMKTMSPNDVTHPEFGKALQEAKKAGVKVFALGCLVEPNKLSIGEEIPIIFNE